MSTSDRFKLDISNVAHQEMVVPMLAKFGSPKFGHYDDHVEWVVYLDNKEQTSLIVRYLGARYGEGWLCFLQRYGQCFEQSESTDEQPAWPTPQTAYANLLLRYQERITRDQTLLSTLTVAQQG